MQYVWTNVDKSQWPRGEWDNEPDKIQWVDEETSLPCMIVRNKYLGLLCGYVGIEPSHRLYGKSPQSRTSARKLSAYGGITFYGTKDVSEIDPSAGLGYVIGENSPEDLWWFGFDCGHYMDLVPAMDITSLSYERYYRNIDFVKNECTVLARQLKDLEIGKN